MEEIKKSCSNCRYSENIRFAKNKIFWDCREIPNISIYEKTTISGDKNDFERFYCSEWEDMFDIKDKQ